VTTAGAAVTVNVVDPLTPSIVAEIDVFPAAAAEARPVAEMLAAPAEDAQVAFEVTSSVDESLLVASAVNCTVVPWTALTFAGVTAIASMVGVELGGGADTDVGALLPHPVAASSAKPSGAHATIVLMRAKKSMAPLSSFFADAARPSRQATPPLDHKAS